MKGLVAAFAVLTMLVASADEALACSPPPGDPEAFQRAETQRYLDQVTTIYTGVFEHMVGRQDDPQVKFTVRKTADVWGYPGAETLDLQFWNGSCQDYLPFRLDGDGSARNGLAVTIFVTPASRIDPEQLYILPTGPYSEAMMADWRATLPRRFGTR